MADIKHRTKTVKEKNLKITKGHYEYWIEKTVKVSWFKNTKSIDINELIPQSYQDKKRDKSFVAHNLLNILKFYRKREGTVVPILKQIAINPGTITNPNKRQAYARQWLRRILQQKNS